MPRVKRGTVHRARRKKVLKQAKGYFGSKHRLYRTSKEQVMRSLNYAYRDRRQKKRDFRKLWITRINAACRENEISYSKFINGLRKAGVVINRKMLSEIAIDDKGYFTNLVEIAKKALNNKETIKVVVPKEELGEETKKIQEVNKEVKQEKEETKEVELTKLTVVELREIAKERKISGYSTMRKADLIKVLEA